MQTNTTHCFSHGLHPLVEEQRSCGYVEDSGSTGVLSICAQVDDLIKTETDLYTNPDQRVKKEF